MKECNCSTKHLSTTWSVFYGIDRGLVPTRHGYTSVLRFNHYTRVDFIMRGRQYTRTYAAYSRQYAVTLAKRFAGEIALASERKNANT